MQRVSLALVVSGIQDVLSQIVLMVLILTTWKANSAECLEIYLLIEKHMCFENTI